MAIRNNGFSKDTDSDRFERLQSLAANIDTYAVELGVVGARLTWAQGAVSAWTVARTTAGIEEGEKNDTFEDFHNYVTTTAGYYATAREMLETIIWEFGGKPDDFVERYGFKVALRGLYSDLFDKIDKWLTEDARLKALIPPDPRVVPDAVTTQLAAHRDAMYALYDSAYGEKQESDAAFAAKFDLFAADSLQLTILFTAARLIWGRRRFETPPARFLSVVGNLYAQPPIRRQKCRLRPCYRHVQLRHYRGCR